MVDDAALAAGALAGHDAVVVADGAPVVALGPGAAGGLRLRRRRRDVRRLARARHRRGRGGRPHAGDDRRRRGRASGSPARRSPWAAAWWSTTTTRSSSAGTSWPPTARVLSGWTLGLAGRAPGDPRRAASARAAPCSSPSTPSSAASSESAEALLTSALTGATPGARRSARESQIASPSMHEQRHVALAGERLDLGAVALAPRPPAPPRTSTPCRRSSRATRPHGHSQSVGVRQRCSVAPSRREAPQRARRACAGRGPAARSASGWRVPGAVQARRLALAVPVDRRLSVSSWWARASSRARAWPSSSGRSTTATTRGPRPCVTAGRPGQPARRRARARARPAAAA